MITINTINKYPKKVYLRYILPCFIVLFLISLTSMDLSMFFGAFLGFSIFIGIPYSLFFFFRVGSYSFVVTENSITENYGVITKKSETVTFDKIQNIKYSSGLINRLFHLTQLNIWTASPSQTITHNGTSENEPNIFLILDTTDADWIKNYILNKTNSTTEANPTVPINTNP